VESDLPCPINVYGASKLAGEHLVCQAANRWMLVRMASLFGKTGARGKNGNFIETIIRKAKAGESLSVVDDVRMSPTYAQDAARTLTQLMKNGAEGVVHVVNDGACSWYEFAKQTLEFAGFRCNINPASSADYPSRARRPTNSVLQSHHPGIKLRSWQEALRAYLAEKGHLTSSRTSKPESK
jgi:dTDP-4-dehydrorhamnose reductase